jgi:FG-GAP-like repeat
VWPSVPTSVPYDSARLFVSMGVSVANRVLSVLVALAVLLGAVAPAAGAVEAAGCTRDDEFVEVVYWCAGDGIDLSQIQKDATQLYVQNGTVLDWTILKTLTSLRSVAVEGAANADVAGITNIPASVRFVHLQGEEITSLAPLAGFSLSCIGDRCESGLYLELPGVTDLRPLSGINAGGCAANRCVKYLEVYADKVTDFSPLGKIGSLKQLSISAYQDRREAHLLYATFPLPKIIGLTGTVVTPVLDIDPQHAIVDPLTARATVYREGWVDTLAWPLEKSIPSAFTAAGTKLHSAVGRTYVVTRQVPKGDFNGDGKTDLLARDKYGVLWLYPGNGKGALLPRIRLGAGWNIMTAIVAPGDFNGDRKADLLARDTSGILWLYPGNGKSGWLPRVQVGTGWNGMTALVAAADFNSDGRNDVLARDKYGVLWLYPGNGKAGWLPRVKVGSGWNIMTALAGGDPDPNTSVELFARDTSGVLWLYQANGKGGWLPRFRIGAGWNTMTALASPGDLIDGYRSDVVARDSSGVLWLYRYQGTGPRIRVGSGWNIMTMIH